MENRIAVGFPVTLLVKITSTFNRFEMEFEYEIKGNALFNGQEDSMTSLLFTETSRIECLYDDLIYGWRRNQLSGVRCWCQAR